MSGLTQGARVTPDAGPRARRRLCALLAALAASGALVFAQEQPKDGRYYEQQARAAFNAKDYPAFLAAIRRASELRPNHPRVLYNLAAAYALNGDRAAALGTLSLLTRMGLSMPAAREPAFALLKDSPEFARVAAEFERNRAPAGGASAAFSLREHGLITEGLAYDPATKSFFVGSVHKRKIVRVAPDGTATDFATAADGLWSVMGMKVDAKRRRLWVATTALPQMVDFRPEDDGRSGVLEFDLKTGKPAGKHLLPDDGKKHNLGDLTLDARGGVYASDSASPAVYLLPRGGARLEPYLTDGRLKSPQGLAFSDDGRTLFLADYSEGLFRVDAGTKAVTWMRPPADGTLLGIDGLYFHSGRLVATQNGVNPQRVVLVTPSRDLSSVTRVETLAANHAAFDEPTLGALVGDAFYFNAASQWGKIDDKGKLAPPEQLRDAVVLRLAVPKAR